jgi:LPS export ABC transporter permease LptG
MKQLDRHIWREVLGPLVIATVSFVVLIVGHLLFRVITTVVERGVPLWAVARFVMYQVPNALGLALPVSMLLASSLAIHRLARDNELVAIRAAGVTLVRVLWPVWVLGLIVSGISFVVSEYVQPHADRRAEGIVTDMLFSQRTLALQPGKFVYVTEDLYFLPGEVDDKTGTIGHLKVFWIEPKGTVTFIEADRAHLGKTECVLERPVSYRFDRFGRSTKAPAWRAVIHLPETIATFRSEQKTRANMGVGEILRQIRAQRGADPSVARPLVVELHQRISLAVACLAFAIIGAPAPLLFRGGHSIGGVLAVILFGFAYYVGMLWARMLGESGALPPALAAWLPNAVTGALGAALLWRRC